MVGWERRGRCLRKRKGGTPSQELGSSLWEKPSGCTDNNISQQEGTRPGLFASWALRPGSRHTLSLPPACPWVKDPLGPLPPHSSTRSGDLHAEPGGLAWTWAGSQQIDTPPQNLAQGLRRARVPRKPTCLSLREAGKGQKKARNFQGVAGGEKQPEGMVIAVALELARFCGEDLLPLSPYCACPGDRLALPHSS